MCEAFEDMTSCPGLWSHYESHPLYDPPAHQSKGAAGSDELTADAEVSEGFLVISNISKKQNIKSLIAIAISFGIENVIIVGQPGFSVETHGPSISTIPDMHERVTFHHFSNLTECKTFLTERKARLYGVEITDDATSIESADFKGQSCAFMMGNEGAGMNAPQLAACDEFLIIPQYGAGTASLNVSNAAAICLQHFSLQR